MHRHRFDPVSAVLGVLAIVTGLLVATGALFGSTAADIGWWLAAAGFATGLAIVPWGALRTGDDRLGPDPLGTEVQDPDDDVSAG